LGADPVVKRQPQCPAKLGFLSFSAVEVLGYELSLFDIWKYPH